MCNSSRNNRTPATLTTITLVFGLAACEEVLSTDQKPRRPVTAETVKPQAPPPLPSSAPPATAPGPVMPSPEGAVEPPGETPRLILDRDPNILPADPLAAARTLLADGQPGKALRFAKTATDRWPERSSSWNTLGRVQLQLGRREDAIDAFEKAIAINPDNPYAYNNLGLTFILDNSFEEAAEALARAVELTPVEDYMWNNLGIAYEQLDRLDDAREAYRHAGEMGSAKGRDSLARLEGVKSVFRTASVDLKEKTGGAQ
jgi:predicted Zn-dependent protease